ncbi:hypothetical protein V2J09_014229 [Rumex salicifolius]
MVMLKATSPAALAALLILLTLAGESFANLRVGFYIGKCGKNNVEAIVFRVIRTKFIQDPTIVAALLRANGSVRGYEVIDAVKAALEKACPEVVSCADIIVLATRAAVNLAGGRWYKVPTGRRDGTISLADEPNAELVGPSTPISEAIKTFADKGIRMEDFVLLLGAHTTGITHCAFVENRLYNFNGVSGLTDPSMNSTLVPFLKRTCPRDGDGSNEVSLDQSKQGKAANIIDNGFYKAVMDRKGILDIDQKLRSNATTRRIVSKYAVNEKLFQIKFGQAMVKLGRIGVLTGNHGQIRKSCNVVN